MGGRASLEIDADALAQSSGDERRDGRASTGVALRAMIGAKHVFYAIGFGWRLGTSLPGGFLYHAELLPLGVGAGLGDVMHLGVYAGAGISGTTSRVPFAGIFPVEARLDLRIGKRLALGGFARAVWTTGDARNNGAPSSERVDELAAGIRLRLSRYYPLMRNSYGTDGYYITALIEENLGARFIGASFGYSLDFGLK